MDIEFTEEQKILQDSVERMLRASYDFDRRRGIIASEGGWSEPRWQEFANLGLLAAPFSEEAGGLGGGPIATMIIMEAFGRHLVVEPYFETVVLAGALIEALAADAQRRELLDGIMSGRTLWALALLEAQSRHDLHAVSTTAERQGDSYVLHGAKAVVVAAPWADQLIVSARTYGGSREREGVSLFVVDRHAPNLHLQGFKTLDARRAAEIKLEGVRVPIEKLLGQEGAATVALERCRERAIAAQCAEAIGAISELNKATLEYTKTRKQFGVPLGSFQALQHRMVDMFIAQEEATAITYALNATLAQGDDIAKLASVAKAKVGDAGRYVGEQAVQLHGGMGMTEEFKVGHYLKRLVAINIQYGDPAFHTMRCAEDVFKSASRLQQVHATTADRPANAA
ncbi:MAG: acyl-CoA dehydrogenase family protein [Xanthobacteraceae bacterium]